MIELKNVTKYYPTPDGRKYVLKDVSAVFPPGKNIGIFGANGTGKSTLMKLLGKIDYPSSGEINVTGSISWPMGLAGGFQGSMTGRDNARFVCRIYGDSEQTIKEKLAFIHDFSEIGDYFDMPIKSYSSGMRSRLSFAVSMAFDFDYYLIDELTAVGDDRFKKKSAAAMKAKRESGNVIFVSHSMYELKNICDVGVYMRQGEMCIFDDINDAVTAYQDEMKRA
ncbi:ABC transporter ATP-binding protein [Pelagibaculum spongiae]|uniref:ABC transporter ATP-binding protein n=1 Tax=Pelagibaculum spongiae TaxID=2080658 RepID=A0A2V1H1E8_9GAMM|nr:ABC transporter ATP-binding protein [Pelagibaculum spongiae]PVZ70252.1 ABC transporter ATP-binding protein [Pelagibaculum spongiae]